MVLSGQEQKLIVGLMELVGLIWLVELVGLVGLGEFHVVVRLGEFLEVYPSYDYWYT